MSRCSYQFAIIIPTYNRPHELVGCLEALLALNYPVDRFEVIVVDDGSPARLDSVVEPYKRRLNLNLLRIENQGPGAARNAGAAVARGQFLAFTDDDCRPHADWLSKIDARLQTTPQHMLGGRTVNQLAENPYSITSQVIVDAVYGFYNRDPDDARFFASNNMAVPADSFRQLGGFDTSFRIASEDRELCDRWRHAGLGIVYEPQAKVDHAHALNLRSFCQQHFNYGRGAKRYHQVRVQRGSGRMRQDMPFHAQLPRLLRKPLSTLTLPNAIRVTLLLATWQVAYAAGFFFEKLSRAAQAGEDHERGPQNALAPLGRWRIRSVSLLLAALLAGSLFDIATGKEHWPFSDYAMFAKVRCQPTIQVIRLHGVMLDREDEFPLLDYQFLQPLDRSRMNVGLMWILKRPEAKPRLSQLAADCLHRYEALRRQGQHDGPALRGLRIYRQTFVRDRWARNTSKPNKSELLFEFERRKPV